MDDPTKFGYMSVDGSQPDLESLDSSQLVSFDVETTGRDIVRARMLGSSITDSPSHAYFFPTGHTEFPARILGDNSVPKVAHNAIFDRSILKRYGVVVDNIIDTMIAAHLAGEPFLGLKPLGSGVLGKKIIAFEDLKKPMSELTLEEMISYSGPHSITALELWEALEPRLREWGSLSIFKNLEMPLVPVLSDMVLNGAMIDADELRTLGVIFDSKIAIIQDALDHYSGYPGINYRSPDQVADLLFKKLGLPAGKKTKTGKRPSTDARVMEGLRGRHPVINLILQDRQYEKLKGTYVDGLIKRIINGRVHTSFNQTGTRTGRLSSSDPALQNIPVRRAEGRRIRSAFVAPPGYVLLKADADQLELKVLAHYSQDPKMVQAFLDGKDVHEEVAIEVFGDKKERFKGKTLNYITGYGGGDALIAQQTGMSVRESGKWKARYFDTYSGIAYWVKVTKEFCKESGYAKTLHGRLRVIPELMAYDSPGILEHGCREAISTIIQGSSSEIIKLGMRKAWNVLKDSEVKMILQVHDEIIFEVPEEIVRDVVEVLKDTLPYNELSIPITFSFKMGYNWRDMAEIIEED